MICEIIIISILTLIIATTKAIQDKLHYHFEKSIFKNLNGWWNPLESWKNKYKQPFSNKIKHWWYFGIYKPTYDEKFPFSTTLLVSITDAWHFFGLVRNFSIYLIIGLTLNLFYLTFYISFILIFSLLFNKLFNK